MSGRVIVVDAHTPECKNPACSGQCLPPRMKRVIAEETPVFCDTVSPPDGYEYLDPYNPEIGIRPCAVQNRDELFKVIDQTLEHLKQSLEMLQAILLSPAFQSDEGVEAAKLEARGLEEMRASSARLQGTAQDLFNRVHS